MKPKSRAILEHAIELGVKRGYSRAFKYNPEPTEEAIRDTIFECVMGEIYEWFTFEEDE